MAERNSTYGIKLNADGDGLVGAVDKGAEATKKLTERMVDLRAVTKEVGEESGAFTRRMREQTEGINRLSGELQAATQASRLQAEAQRQQSDIIAASSRAQAALATEMRHGVTALKTATTELTAFVGAQAAARAGMASLAGMFTGPAGIVALLATAALSWTNLGNTAEDAGRKAEEAGRKTQVALQMTERERARARQAEIGQEIQGFAAQIQDINRPGRARTPEEISGDELRTKVLQDLITQRAAEARRLGEMWADPRPSIADATRGLRTPSTALQDYTGRVQALHAAYAPEIEGQGSPEYIARMQAEFTEAALAARKQYDAQLKSFEPRPAGRAASGGGGGGFDDGSAMLLGLKNQLAAVSGETSTYDSVLRRITEGTKEFSGEVRAEALALAASIDQRREANEETKRSTAAAAEATKAYNASLEQQWKSVGAMQEQNAKLAQHNREIGLSKSGVDAMRASTEELTLAQLENERSLVSYKDDEDPYVKVLDARIAAQRELIGLLREGAVAEASAASAKKAQEDWKRASDNIERALTDSIIRGFDGGKSFLRNFIDSLVNGFKTAVLQPIIAPIVRPFAQAAAGAIGGLFGSDGGSGSGGGGGFGGIGDAFSLARGANSLFGTNVMGIGQVGGLLGGSAGLTGAAVSGEIAMLTGSGVATSGVASGVGGLMSGIGTALPWIGGALAIGSMLGIFGEGGGPKEQEVLWSYGQGVGNNNITSQDPAFYAATAAMTHKLRADFTPEELMAVPAFSVRGAAGSDPFAMLQQVESHIMTSLAPAIQAKQAKAAAEQAKNAAALGQLQQLGLVESSLKGWVDGQAVSEYLSPEDRLAGARGLFDEALAGAGAGDLDAARALPGLADQLIGAGRGVYASSTKFQDLRGEVYGDLAKVLEQQGTRQADILAEMPAAVLQGAQDTVAAINKMRAELVTKFEELASSLRQRLEPA